MKNEEIVVSFVLLHYQNIEVTLESIQYLKPFLTITSVNLVIVDNASPNKTGKLLMKKYLNEERIHVICTQKNNGFTCGNNIGYEFAKDTLKSEIIIIMNSDVLIKDIKFVDKVLSIHSNYPYVSILAPDIIVKNGYHQNPYLYHAISTTNQKKILIKKVIGYYIYGIPLLRKLFINREKVAKYQPNNVTKDNNVRWNIVPHGSCIIFFPIWVKNEKIAFIPGTFLFVEEEILFDYCQINNHQILYSPLVEVYHLEDASQNAISKSQIDKKRNQIKYEISSRKVLLRLRRRKVKGSSNGDFI